MQFQTLLNIYDNQKAANYHLPTRVELKIPIISIANKTATTIFSKNKNHNMFPLPTTTNQDRQILVFITMCTKNHSVHKLWSFFECLDVSTLHITCYITTMLPDWTVLGVAGFFFLSDKSIFAQHFYLVFLSIVYKFLFKCSHSVFSVFISAKSHKKRIST